MSAEDFVKNAIRTESNLDSIKLSSSDKDVLMMSLDAFTAAGDIMDVYKKHLFYGKAIPAERTITLLDKLITDATDAKFAFEDARGTPEDQQSIEALPVNPRVFHALLGSCTEHAEISGPLSEYVHNGVIDLFNICEELGDSDWYKAVFYDETGIAWEAVRGMVIKKLEYRYPDKCFSDTKAINRDHEAEYALMKSVIKDSVDEFVNAK